MPCYSPLSGWRSRDSYKTIVFNLMDGCSDLPVKVPCGRCTGCRLEWSRQWAMRCVHEASTWNNNCFITLTYNDDNLPVDMSLDKSHYQKFMKRFRKRVSGLESITEPHPVTGEMVTSNPIRYFQCGEYGEEFGRPHYHACIFNYDFPDKTFFKMSNGFPLYRSPLLDDLWPYGYASIGTMTFESAAYVARYCMKKVYGDDAVDHYLRIHPVTGEQYLLTPEYVAMSRRPGIAKRWFDKYLSDVYPCDFVVFNGKKMRPPKFYDALLESVDKSLYDSIKVARSAHHIGVPEEGDDNHPDRLRVRAKVKDLTIQRLIRPLD